MLIVNKLTKKFKSGDYKIIAVNNITLSIKDGTFASIVGKSGSGKSTLLLLLGALDKPDKGEIIVDGQDITKLSDAKLIDYRRNKIGFIFQSYNLIPNLTALENIILPMEFTGVAAGERKKRAQDFLLKVGLDKKKFIRKPAKLSGGEQQRVAIARALANKPSLVLADEPTGNLDSTTGQIIVELLKHLAKAENTTIIAATHDRAISRQAEITFQLSDGKLIS